jgi:hypothetical protein
MKTKQKHKIIKPFQQFKKKNIEIWDTCQCTTSLRCDEVAVFAWQQVICIFNNQ